MTRNTIHKASVALNAAAATAAGVANLSKNKAMLRNLERLGYPRYFASVLGACELLGAMALIAPKAPRLKEWAYAGFTFTYAGAFFSHIAKGEKKHSVAPLVSLILLMSAYTSRPRSDP